MPLNQVNFKNLHFNLFYSESFFDIEDERDPGEIFLMRLMLIIVIIGCTLLV